MAKKIDDIESHDQLFDNGSSNVCVLVKVIEIDQCVLGVFNLTVKDDAFPKLRNTLATDTAIFIDNPVPQKFQLMYTLMI